MSGTVGILNVGAGDIRLEFDRSNPAEFIRAGRIVRDMIRRGYALLVEVEREGEKRFERALDFDEERSVYIIADLDPAAASGEPLLKTGEATVNECKVSEEDPEVPAEGSVIHAGRGRRRAIPASGTRAVAVARSAGG